MFSKNYSRPPNCHHNLWLYSSLQSSHLPDRLRLSKIIHFMLQVIFGQGRDHWSDFKSPNFLWTLSSWGTYLLSLFIFHMFCKWRETVVILTQSVWDISLTFWQGFCPTTACTCSLSRLHARPLLSSSSRFSFPLRNWNHLGIVRSTVDHFLHALLMLKEVSETLSQIWTRAT